MVKGTRSSELDALVRNVAEVCLGRRARELGRAVGRIYDQHFRPHGLTGSQWTLLVAIQVLGAPSPTELTHRLDLEKSTLSRNLKLMEGEGWVSIDAGEGRGRTVSLTPVGRSLLQRAYPAWQAAQRAARAWLRQGNADLMAVDPDLP